MNLPDVTRVEFLTELYREMPSYRLLAFKIEPSYRNFSPQARSAYWDFVREMLSSSEDALADPVVYDLWCGLFEDRAYVQEAWNELVGHHPSRRQLERVLESSGPVPFALKHDLYTKLIQDQSWHYYIYKSLLYSNFDYYGENDRFVAREILKKLTLPPETEYLKDLELALGI